MKRLPLIALAAAALLFGVWTGLLRVGLAAAPEWLLPRLPQAHHAALMISGFLGTLIGIERAVALGRAWGWAGPALSGIGAVLLLLAPEAALGPLAMVAAAAAMTAVMVELCRRQPALDTAVMAAAPLGWLAGNVLVATGSAPAQAVPGWAAFLILTIAGERLILSRLVGASRSARRVFALACALCLGGGLAVPLDRGPAILATGLGWVLMASWLLHYDVARRRMSAGGLPRFVGAALLTGYLWLAIAGLLLLTQGLDPAPRALTLPGLGAVVAFAYPYDATLHALLLGFVFSMIFAHAPIVLPAVTGTRLPWRNRFWMHLVLLHGSLALRVAADLTGHQAVRSWSGVGNAVAIAVFAASTVIAVRSR